MADLQLGQIVKQMRCGDIYARDDLDRKAALDAVGFDWKAKEGEDDDFLLFQYDEVGCMPS